MPRWVITAAGTLGFDDLTTPAGSRTALPGGSALYFALAAHRFCEVRLVAAVGTDGRALIDLLDAATIDRSGVVQMNGDTYRWRAEHHPAEPVPIHQEQRLGVYLDWEPEVPLLARTSEILFLGSMPPQRQLEVLAQCRPTELVALDTMTDFIATDRSGLEELLERCDMLFVNEEELRSLFPVPLPDALDLAREAVAHWDLRMLILKRGVLGAVQVSLDDTRVFPALAGSPVVDPTGAGDALAGGVLGRLAELGRRDDGALAQAMAAGSLAARATISAFGVEGLRGDPG
ncbi:MAG TPA: PfkB family carbohydrate kinase [Candidatus Dormibacteraeota bacterium]|nr:PfkB family carbohydrate kinase [Candidatus Dormibacteraeota bacterium]